LKTIKILAILVPIWIVVVIATVLLQIMPIDFGVLDKLETIYWVVTCILLPLVIGFLLYRITENLVYSIIGAVSLSIINLGIINVWFHLEMGTLKQYVQHLGYAFIFEVAPQIFFGITGGYLSSKYNVKKT